MEETRRQKQLEIRKESLKKRMPLVVLILICFLLYNFVIPMEILKWASVVILVVYLGIGFYYRKKLREELDKIPYESKDENEIKEVD